MGRRKGNLNLGFCDADGGGGGGARPIRLDNRWTNPDGTCKSGNVKIFTNNTRTTATCGKCSSNQYFSDGVCLNCPPGTTSQLGTMSISGCKANTPSIPRRIPGDFYGSYTRTDYNEDDLNARRNTPYSNSGAEERYLNQKKMYNRSVVDIFNTCIGIGIVGYVAYKSYQLK